MRQSWWKILAIALLIYTLTAGLLMDVPRLPILNE
ncbi:MAG TPA: ABC transporter permease, partial [Algoriphagus sp.]|nr:ABC transporter permease [Algoriphagus sp.]